jgi:hypothetical protein
LKPFLNLILLDFYFKKTFLKNIFKNTPNQVQGPKLKAIAQKSFF